MITQEQLKEALEYDQENGFFTWKHRPLSHFKSEAAMRTFNTRFPGVRCRTTKPSAENPYVSVRLFGRSYKQHRLAFLYVYGFMPNEIDHINGIHNDNRIANLAAASRSENAKNLPTRLKSKFLAGISIDKGKFRVRISVNKKEVNLGHYSCYLDACCAKKSAERKYGYGLMHGRIPE